MQEILDRRGFLRAAVATSVGTFLFQDSSIFERDTRGSSARGRGFETVGLYASLPTDPPPKDPRVYDFFKACGHNYLEFCEAEFRFLADLLPEYYKDMSRALALARVMRIRAEIVLL